MALFATSTGGSLCSQSRIGRRCTTTAHQQPLCTPYQARGGPATHLFAAGRLTRASPAPSLAARAADQQGMQPDEPSRHSSHQPVQEIPWNDETEAAVCHFWVSRGFLDSHSEQLLPEEAAQDSKRWSNIKRYAATHQRHRDVAFLRQQMAAWDAAAAELGVEWDVNRLALQEWKLIGSNCNPQTLVRKYVAVQDMFAAAGIPFNPYNNVKLMSFQPETIAARLHAFLEEAPEWGRQLDIKKMLSNSASTMLNGSNYDAVGRRLAALQSLHPDLDVAELVLKQPRLAYYEPSSVRHNWDNIKSAAGIGDGEMAVLVNAFPDALARNAGVVAWKLRTYRQFQAAWEAAGSPNKGRGVSFPTWLGALLSASDRCIQRLEYLMSIGCLEKKPFTIAREKRPAFERRHPEFKTWSGPSGLPKKDRE